MKHQRRHPLINFDRDQQILDVLLTIPPPNRELVQITPLGKILSKVTLNHSP